MIRPLGFASLALLLGCGATPPQTRPVATKAREFDVQQHAVRDQLSAAIIGEHTLAAGADAIYQRAVGGWQRLSIYSNAFEARREDLDTNVSALWASEPSRYLAATDGGLYELDLSRRTMVEQPPRGILWDVWIVPGGDAYAVGDDGAVWTRKQGQWALTTVEPPADLEAVHGAASRHVFAVGDRHVYRQSAGRWMQVYESQDGLLSGLWVFPDGNVIVVGGAGKAITFDGARWRETHVPGAPDLLGVWARSPDDIIVCGRAGFVGHFDGSRWRRVPTGTEADLYGVIGTDRELLVVGEDMILEITIR